jgi:hypothetical protein
MARHYVRLPIDCSVRPTPEELAFLNPLQGTADSRGNELTVTIDVNAGDVVDALSQARDLIIGKIAGQIQLAEVVATEGMRFPPAKLFRRRRCLSGSGDRAG